MQLKCPVSLSYKTLLVESHEPELRFLAQSFRAVGGLPRFTASGFASTNLAQGVLEGAEHLLACRLLVSSEGGYEIKATAP